MTARTIKEFQALTGPDALTPAETRLVEACRAGEPCNLGTALPAAPTPDNTIRADLLRVLITGGTADCGLDPAGVMLTGGWITGQLDLSYRTARGRTWLDKCRFEQTPNHEFAQLQSLSLIGSALPGLWAQHAKITGSARLLGARVDGTVDLTGADIGGQLTFTGATLDGKGSEALYAQGVKVGADVFLNAVTATGTVDMNGAEIGAQLACDGATLDGKDGKALNAQGVRVRADLFLSSVTAMGTVVVAGAEIGGQLACDGATLDGKDDKALHAQRVKVKASIFLRSLNAKGAVTVNGADIGGQLSFTGAILNGNSGEALNAQGVKVGANLFLNSVTSTGTVDMSGADIGGQLACEAASFNGGGGKALRAQGVKVGLDLVLRSVTAKGTVDVNGAKIGGQVTFVGAYLEGGGGDALSAQQLRAERGFVWHGLRRLVGAVDLNGTSVSDLVDEMASWPVGLDQLILDGFTYERIFTGPVDSAARLRWLHVGANFNGTFFPQPYTQLAKVLAEMGHAAESRVILLERERRLAEEKWKADRAAYQVARDGRAAARGDMGRIWLGMWLSRLWSSAIRRVAGYGYAPQRALYWAAGFVGLATVLYFLGWQLGVMVPNSAVILTSSDWAAAMGADPLAPAHGWGATGSARHYETFYSLAYATDVFVPLVDLGQESAWAVTTVTWTGFALRWFTFVLEIVGWIVTALGAAAITGIIQRGRE